MKTRSAENAHGMEGSLVTCGTVFDQETEKIFSRNWVCLGRLTEIPADSGCWATRFENHDLLVVQSESGSAKSGSAESGATNSGAVKVFRNFCRHRGARLVTTESQCSVGQRLQCPYHAWTYDRDGRLVAAPNMDGVDTFDAEQFGLIELECEVWHGFIFVRLNRGGDSLSTFLEPLESLANDWSVDSLKVGATLDYEVAANWKLIFQNYSECYHCPIVHPALNRLTPYQGASNELESGPILGGPMKLSDESETMSTSGRLVGTLLPKLDAEQKRLISYFTICPTIFLSAHPDYVLVHYLERIDVSRSKVRCDFLFHPEALESESFDPQDAVEFWDLTNRQDWHVCELTQLGMSNPEYQPGPYSNLESVLAAFDQHYYELMAD